MNKVAQALVAIALLSQSNRADAFTCTQQGLFANTDANDCTTYIACDGNLNPTVKNCVSGTYYWPEKKGCFDQYNCATQSMPGNSHPCDGATWYSLPNPSGDCTKYLACEAEYVNQINGYVLQAQLKVCPSGTAFRPNYGCVENYPCANYQCTSEGYFPNANDCSSFIDCQKYTIKQDKYALFNTLYTCPLNSKFNPVLKKCDSTYNCDGVNHYGATDPCATFNWQHPLVPNPLDASASTYLLCQYRFDNNFNYEPHGVLLTKQCPANTFFSPLLAKCYHSYNPSVTCSKDPCLGGPGKRIRTWDPDCKSFYEVRDDSTTPELYDPTFEIRNCPPGSFFSHSTLSCSRQYVCPASYANYCYPQVPTTTVAPTTTTAVAAK